MDVSENNKTAPVDAKVDGKRRFDYTQVYDDTRYFIDGMIKQYNFYPEILQSLRDGDATMELRKRIMLRAIDETWVRIVEDTIPSLDTMLRKPSRIIEERDEVLPIELSRSITSRSIRDLAQHTNYISKVEGENVIPNKIMNVFRDETMLTYENKFLNTLIDRLVTFVNRRYQIAKNDGMDTKTVSVEFSEKFIHGDVKGKIHFGIEVEEPPVEGDVAKNYTYTTDIWRRIERLNSVCLDYTTSEFVTQMGKNYLRPPISRTNAMLKNKDLRQCLALWEFIETYENTGYTTLVEESLEEIDADYIRDIYETMALEYLIFRKKIHGGFEEDKTLDHILSEEPYSPQIIEKLVRADDREFDTHYDRQLPMPNTDRYLTEADRRILEAIDVALEADAAMRSEDGHFRSYLRRSFLAKLIQSETNVKDYYGELKNELLSYKKIKARMSFDGETFTRGRKKCARITIKGKTLVIYLALDPNAYDRNKYHFTDESDKAKYADIPMALKVRSGRALKYAFELISYVMASLGIEKDPKAKHTVYDMPYEGTKELIAKGLIKVIGDPELPDDESEDVDEPLDTGEVADEDESDGEEADDTEGADESEESEGSDDTDDADDAVTEGDGDGDMDGDGEGDADGEAALVSADGKTRFVKSFTARLICAGEPLQSYYNEIKNTLLSYKKVKCRVSSRHESFNCGRTKIARIAVRGKTLMLYLALDPAEYADSKYRFTDASGVSRYADVPMALKIKSQRAVKYAKELIAAEAGKLGIPEGKPSCDDFRPGFKTTEELLLLGLVKTTVSKFNFGGATTTPDGEAADAANAEVPENDSIADNVSDNEATSSAETAADTSEAASASDLPSDENVTGKVTEKVTGNVTGNVAGDVIADTATNGAASEEKNTDNTAETSEEVTPNAENAAGPDEAKPEEGIAEADPDEKKGFGLFRWLKGRGKK